jgi:proline dehydrogenase
VGATRRALLWLGELPGAQGLVQGLPVSRHLVRRFVAGDTVADALDVIEDLNGAGVGGVLDELGEGVRELDQAERASRDYDTALDAVSRRGTDTTVAIKLTQLGLLVDPDGCVRRIVALCEKAARLGIHLEIDMEQSDVVDQTLQVYRQVAASYRPPRLAVQAYLHRTPDDLRTLAPLKAPIRLVKGAYAEPEDQALQEPAEISARYRELMEWLFDNHPDPALGTHDGAMLGHAQLAARRRGLDRRSFEVQMLYGVRRELQLELARSGHRVRVYVPFGSAWYPYLVRRLAERPANLRFFARSLVQG